MTTTGRIARVSTVLALLGATTIARAGGVVGTGTPASCTPAALVQALAGGGTVTFDCGSDPHSIVLPQRQTITADTTIAGDGRIDLSGNGVHGLLTVQSGRALTLDRVGIRDGGVENWAVYVSNGAALQATGVTVQGCSRGGIYNAGGTVTVSDATFADNDATAAGAALTNENGGQLTVLRTTFHANLNGAVFSAGPATITDSVFTENHGDSGGGGAILHSDMLTVTRCRFEGNQATGGGAIYSSDHLTVEDSVFRDNTATVFDGGAIQLYNQTQSPSSVTVRGSTFTGNAALRSGGAVRCDAPSGGCTLENVTFSNNAADQGAAELSLKSGAIVVNHATVVATSTPAIERIAGTLTLKSSVVAGGACAGAITDGGGNVQSASGLCAASFATGDPALAALDDNGGRTPTHEIAADSAARGAATGCLPTDQRGVARPAMGCDAGAFQRGAVPTLLLLAPNHTQVGGPDFTMIVQGASFLAGSAPTRVLWNGTPLATVTSSPTEIVVSVPSALIATVGVATVTVENPNPPVPDGGPSAQSLPFTIDEKNDDVPPPPPPPPPAEGPCDGLTSFAAVLCAIEQARTPGHFCGAADLDPKLDRPLQAALTKAAMFVGSAQSASAKKRPKLLRKAKAQLEKVARRAGTKRAGKTTADCKATVAGETRALAGGVAGLSQ